MKILIADDNNEKVARVIAALLENSQLSRDDIHVAHTIADVRRELQSSYFDLLVLDILLPGKAGEAPAHTGTLSLLEELSTRKTLQKPSHIVGLTAFEDAIRSAGSEFVRRTWTVIQFDPGSTEWKGQLLACVAYIVDRLAQAVPSSYATDLCIVTALSVPELSAVERLPWGWQAIEPLDDNTFVRRGEFLSQGARYTVVAAAASKVGMVSSALLSAKLIERERPRFIVMGGICAGIKGKVSIGDVVIGDPVWDWQCGKHFSGPGGHGFAIAPDPVSLASFVRARMQQLRQDQLVWDGIRNAWPASPPGTALRAFVGPMASGAAVVADQDVIDGIVDQNRNCLAVDMEAFAVSVAASFAGHPRPTSIVMKAVCDFADSTKADDFQPFAAYASANAIRVFFERYMSDLVPLAGTT
jgi:nucleoside phosphorylase/CheY-like chemotaxis protein